MGALVAQTLGETFSDTDRLTAASLGFSRSSTLRSDSCAFSASMRGPSKFSSTLLWPSPCGSTRLLLKFR